MKIIYIQTNKLYKMKTTKGGKREGAGRPKNDNKAYLIQCHPSKIKEVKEFAKKLSSEMKIFDK